MAQNGQSLTGLPHISGPGKGRGSGPMPPLIMQAPGATLQAPPQPPSKHFNDAVRNFAVNGTANRAGLSGPQIAVAAAAAARAAAAAALQPDLPEGCARACAFHHSQLSGERGPKRLSTAELAGPVIVQGDGTEANYHGLNGWAARRGQARKPVASAAAAASTRGSGRSRRRAAQDSEEDQDEEFDSDASAESRGPNGSNSSSGAGSEELSPRTKRRREAEEDAAEKAERAAAVPDPDRPVLHSSDEDSEYEALRRARQRSQTARGRRVAKPKARYSPPLGGPPVAVPKAARARPSKMRKVTHPAAAAAAARQPGVPLSEAPSAGGLPSWQPQPQPVGGATAAAMDGLEAQPTYHLARDTGAAAADSQPHSAQRQITPLQESQRPPRPSTEQPWLAEGQEPQGGGAAWQGAAGPGGQPGASPVAHSDGFEDGDPDEGTSDQLETQAEDEYEEDEEPFDAPAEPVVLVREVTEEQKAADRAAVLDSPAFATVLDFFEVFGPLLGLDRTFTADQLAAVLVASPGDEGLLSDVHMALLRGLASRKSSFDAATWCNHMANRLMAHWRGSALWVWSDPPFMVTSREEAAANYAALPALDRVAALKAICEMRVDRDDLRGVVDAAAAGPGRKKKADRGPDPPTLEDFRRAPLGTDSLGRDYWYHHFYNTTGMRLYRRTPPAGTEALAHEGKTAEASAAVASTAASSADLVALSQPGEGEAGPLPVLQGATDAASDGAPAVKSEEAAVKSEAGAMDVDDVKGAEQLACAAETSAAAASRHVTPPQSPTASDDGGRPPTPQRVDGIGADVKSRVRAARPRPGSAIDSGAGPRPPPTPRPAPREKALREAPGSEGGPAGAQRLEDEAAGGWECVAASVEALQVLVSNLRSTGCDEDAALASLIMEDLVVRGNQEAARAERREKARERQTRHAAAAAAQALPSNGEALGRGGRTRKTVDYTYGGYDESIKAAVRVRGGSSGDDDFVVPRWARAEEPLPTVSEQVAAGLRRGRSHRDAPLLQPLENERALGPARSRTPASAAPPYGGCGEGAGAGSSRDGSPGSSACPASVPLGDQLVQAGAPPVSRLSRVVSQDRNVNDSASESNHFEGGAAAPQHPTPEAQQPQAMEC